MTALDEKLERLEACPDLARAFALLGKRWTALILDVLSQRPARFTEIRRAVPKLSERLLSERLHELTDAGIVEQRADDTTGMLYALTPVGVRLAPALDELRRWARDLEASTAGARR